MASLALSCPARLFAKTPRRAAPHRSVAVRASGGRERESSVSGTAMILFAQPAFASSSEEVAATVQRTLDTASGLASQAAGVADEVVGGARVAAEFIKPYVDAATPVVASAAKESVRIATPLVEGGLRSAAKQLQGSGVDVDGALKSAAAAAKATAPVAQEAASAVSGAVSSLLQGDPATLSSAVGAAALALLLTPLLVPLLAGLLRGYAADLTPAQTLDLLSQGDALLVDIRKTSELEAKGVPVLPRGQAGKLARVEFDSISDRALRSAMSDPQAVEADSTARIIADLKKASKGKPLILMDANASLAKLVARKLAALGFRKVYVIEGGFEGRGGWVSAGLASQAVASVAARPTSSFSIPGTTSMRKQ